ncbi:MAG: histidine phosphatase family protein [Porticoccaceae bacterium]
MKQLVLIRHAKSSWKDPALSDLMRPLKKRGERDARDMAKRLNAQGLSVEKVFMSPALRVIQTLDTMATESGFGRDISEIAPDLYTFSYEAIMLYIKELCDTYSSVAVIGHNPAITDLVNFLALEEIANIPTCGIVVLNLNIEKWSKIRAGSAAISYYDYPKNDVDMDI